MTLLKMTPAQIEQIKEAAAAGESLSSIAGRFGVSRSGVHHHVKDQRRAGIGPPPKGSIRSVRKCPTCPLLFAVKLTSQRKHCSDACRIAGIEREGFFFIEEVRWIAGTDSWTNIAARLGYKNVRTLARRLASLGALDLSRQAELMDMPREYQRAA